MKKILFMILFCILGFVPKSFAFHDLPYSLPATPPGAIETFSNYIQFYDYQGYEYLIYCSSTNDATTYNTNNVVSGYYAPYYISFTNVSCNSSQYSYYQYNANTNAWYYNLWNSGSVFLDHTQSLANTVRTTVNLKNISGTLTLPSNFSAYGWSGSTTISQNQIIVPAGTNITHSVSVARSPEAGGGVASLSGEETQPNCEAEDGLLCGVCEYNYCTGNVPSNSTVKFGAFPNSGYAFAYWEWNGGSSSSTANPETFTMSGDLGLVAVFKRTFRCASGDFYEPYDPQDPEIYGDGECVTYVRHETGADIYGNANTWYQGAINAGYYTTAGPSIPTGKDMNSAIIVFGIVSESSFPTGHVGIVINKVDSTHLNIRDANWNLDGKLDEHVIDVTNENYNILGYIYCTP